MIDTLIGTPDPDPKPNSHHIKNPYTTKPVVTYDKHDWESWFNSHSTDFELTEVQREIIKVCQETQEMLIIKNRKYGNSALDPIRIFSRSDAKEQIDVRIDDKLNRIKNRASDEDEDLIGDLIGYLVLRRVRDRLKDGNI